MHAPEPWPDDPLYPPRPPLPPEQDAAWPEDPIPVEEVLPVEGGWPPQDPLVPVVELVPNFGWSILAWILIIKLIVAIFWLKEKDFGGEPNLKPIDLELFVLKLQGRYLVGAKQMTQANSRQLLAAAEKQDSYEAQLHYAILHGELESSQSALTMLEAIQGAWQDTPENRRLRKIRGILLRLYDDYHDKQWHAPSVDREERQYLEQEMGWYGKLAFAPPEGPLTPQRSEVLATARSTVMGMVGGMFVLLGLGVVGLIGLILVLIFALLGKMRGGIRTGEPHGGVYAETFALWMLAFVGLSLAWHVTLEKQVPQEHRWFLFGLLELGSLLLLLWPVLRGVPWAQVRQDIGLTLGRQPLLEPFVGIGTYVMCLPLLVVGVLFMLLLKSLGVGGDKAAPFADAHPIVFELADAQGWKLVQIIFLACVVAPIVEEIMFRGVLYRQVREGTAGVGRVGSVILGALVVSFVFAIIHPQGIVAVPVLMALAIGFTLAREWRGTLIPAMIAHGINNGVALSAVLWLLRG